MIASAHDFYSVEGAAERFEAAYQKAVRDMKALLDATAAEARRAHEYQNRTGELEASTYASDILSLGDADEVQLGVRTSYAEYVNQRGLVGIDELAGEAEVEIAYLLDGLAVVL